MDWTLRGEILSRFFSASGGDGGSTAADVWWPRSCGVNGAASPIGYKNPSPNSICSQFSFQNHIHISNIRPIRLFSRSADLTAASHGGSRWFRLCCKRAEFEPNKKWVWIGLFRTVNGLIRKWAKVDELAGDEFRFSVLESIKEWIQS
ncbi:hypothetical protein CASFOL_036873 [Castilleja foliolosa]|uniref:Uncharacterized protein n=1 Tax=Castilleja foliolosa TaxID=1961234 RepID=A0ABD3BP69_9LAMI